jgi:hypothetical protein
MPSPPALRKRDHFAVLELGAVAFLNIKSLDLATLRQVVEDVL